MSIKVFVITMTLLTMTTMAAFNSSFASPSQSGQTCDPSESHFANWDSLPQWVREDWNGQACRKFAPVFLKQGLLKGERLSLVVAVGKEEFLGFRRGLLLLTSVGDIKKGFSSARLYGYGMGFYSAGQFFWMARWHELPLGHDPAVLFC